MESSYKTVVTLLKKFFNEEPVYVQKVNNDPVNSVYKAILLSDKYLIIRISTTHDKLNNFLKEQWCSRRARESGVPAIEILEVGNSVIDFPYMIAVEEYGIPGNKYLGDKSKMWEGIGKYLSEINKIKTKGVGHTFDWSSNTISFNDTWKDYLEKSFHIDHILDEYKREEIITPDNLKKLASGGDKIKKWEFENTLAHGELIPENVILSKQGEIKRILDWKNSRSGNSKMIDLSITLNSAKKKEKELVLKGYGIPQKEYEKIAIEIDSLYILRKRHEIRGALDNGNKKYLERMKKKFNLILQKY